MGQREEWVPGLKALALFKAKPGDWPGINLDLEKVLISLYCQQYYSDVCARAHVTYLQSISEQSRYVMVWSYLQVCYGMILSVLIHTVIDERKCKDILQNVLVITT